MESIHSIWRERRAASPTPDVSRRELRSTRDDLSAKEGTIESQVLALKKQIAVANHVLVKAANGGEVPDITELAQRYGLSLAQVTARQHYLSPPRHRAASRDRGWN